MSEPASHSVVVAVHKHDVELDTIRDKVRHLVETAALNDVRVSVAMNQHIRRRKPVNKLVILDAIDMMLLDFIFFSRSMAISESLRHGTNKERTATARHIKHDRVLIHVANLRHEVGDVVRRERLILIGLTNVLVERNEEQVEQILTCRAFVVDEREILSLINQESRKILTGHITYVLALQNALVNQGQLLGFLQDPSSKSSKIVRIPPIICAVFILRL